MKNDTICNVIMLPAKVNGPIWKGNISGQLMIAGETEYLPDNSIAPQHLYFTSETDKIQKGDWHYHPTLGIIRTGDEFIDIAISKARKIVGTTDINLSSVPIIQPEFVRAYIESNGKISKVRVEQGNGRMSLKWDIDSDADAVIDDTVDSLQKRLYAASVENARLIGKITELEARTPAEESKSDAAEFAIWLYNQKQFKRVDAIWWRKLNTELHWKTEQLYDVWKSEQEEKQK